MSAPGTGRTNRPAKRLTDRDTADHVFLLMLAVRIAPPVMLVLMGVEYWLYGNRLLWFLLPNVAMAALAVLGANWLLGQVSRGGGSLLFPSGKGTPVAREFSEQEALIVRGQYQEAADAFRAIIAENPADIEPQLRLGRLFDAELNDPVSAAETFRRVRWLHPTPQQDWAASNALIDLYHRTGQVERLKGELARVSRNHSGKAAGDGARRRLVELNESPAGSRPPSSDVIRE